MMDSFNKLFDLLSNPDLKSFVVLPHIFPDGDTLGSAIGVYYLIKHFNKEGYIVLNDDIPSNLSFIFDENTPVYKSEEFNNKKFDVCIAVDCGEIKLFLDRLQLFNEAKVTVNIDHHKTNTQYASLNIVDESISSTGELVFSILEHLDVPKCVSCAQALYTAIVTDTGSFRYTNTTPSTFMCASQLLSIGFDFNRVNVELFQSKSIEKMLLLNKVFDTLQLHNQGRIAFVKLNFEMMSNLKLSEYDTDGIVEYVRDIKGVEVVVFFRQIDNSTYKVSMRSKYEVDVSQVAQAFGGGGHTKAAGFKIEGSISRVEMLLQEHLKEALN